MDDNTIDTDINQENITMCDSNMVVCWEERRLIIVRWDGSAKVMRSRGKV